jgi:hypothetical protein
MNAGRYIWIWALSYIVPLGLGGLIVGLAHGNKTAIIVTICLGVPYLIFGAVKLVQWNLRYLGYRD